MITRVEEACVGREEKKKKIGRVWPGSKSGGSNLDLRGLQVTYQILGTSLESQALQDYTLNIAQQIPH